MSPGRRNATEGPGADASKLSADRSWSRMCIGCFVVACLVGLLALAVFVWIEGTRFKAPLIVATAVFAILALRYPGHQGSDMPPAHVFVSRTAFWYQRNEGEAFVRVALDRVESVTCVPTGDRFWPMILRIVWRDAEDAQPQSLEFVPAFRYRGTRVQDHPARRLILQRVDAVLATAARRLPSAHGGSTEDA